MGEHDVLVRSWLTEIIIEESMFLIIGCLTAKQMWTCHEDTYLQASKDKEFQLKEQIRTMKLGLNLLMNKLRSFKGFVVVLKVINFARGLGSKYKTFTP